MPLHVTHITFTLLEDVNYGKLKGANVWPFDARGNKWLEAEFIIHDHCTGTVKRKLIKLDCSDI